MNTKIKLTILAFLLFLSHFAFALTIELTPSSFPCGTTTVSATTGCSFMGAIEVTVEGNPSGVVISNVSMIVGGAFTFNITVSASSPAVGQLNFRVLTSNDPTGCALPNAQDDVAVNFLCACNLVVTTTTTDESCFECANGTATITLVGASDPITYLWSNGATTDAIENLAPGDYSVVITDGNNCVSTSSVTINPYICTPFQIVSNVISAICHDDCNGSISIVGLSDGSSPVLIAWNTGENSNSLINLCAATYVATVTNENNCAAISSFVISQSAPIVLTIDTVINFSPAAPGRVIISMSGVQSGYSCGCQPITGICGICVETSLTSASMEGLSVGCYQMIITNPNGCAAITDTFCIQDITSSIKDIKKSNIQIFPNPASDVITVQYQDGSLPEEMVLKNVFGTTIARYSHTNTIDVSALQSGLYFVTFYNQNHTFTHPITIQR